MIEISGLSKSYGQGAARREVLAGIDLQVAGGELVSVEGISGCGKTTLLNLIGGLDRDHTGRIVVGGCDLGTLDDRGLARFRNETVGFVFQHFYLLDHMTCGENVLLPSFFADRPTPAASLRARAQEVLGRVGLATRIDDLPTRLSGGQKQRLAIARALFAQPRLMLCDEPTGNLDSATGEQILELFRTLNREEGLTLVIVTHEPRVSAVAQRVIRMEDGKIVAGARP
ncbi:MAG: ABC transporter ATP-binding protein [Myxococcota bacterium]|jgi:ABC-type lipoprotein export system ATPase subunit|nr:ABC transporter ATP-binding protein [Myxococcota bacterium]